MFHDFKRNNPGTDITYTLYKHILSKFFKKASDYILEGEKLRLGHKLGNIYIKKVRRNPDKPMIDWGETNKLKAQGINKLVYYTDEFWYRWAWEKNRAALRNKSVYKFSATKGINGNVKKLVRKLKEDPFAEVKFSE